MVLWTRERPVSQSVQHRSESCRKICLPRAADTAETPQRAHGATAAAEPIAMPRGDPHPGGPPAHIYSYRAHTQPAATPSSTRPNTLIDMLCELLSIASDVGTEFIIEQPADRGDRTKRHLFLFDDHAPLWLIQTCPKFSRPKLISKKSNAW